MSERSGEQDSSSVTLPLAELRIIEISTYVAGPSGAMALAQLGADVIRVDPIGGATDIRRLPLDAEGHSLYWAGLNKAKRSVEIDLRRDEGRELVLRLLSVEGGEGGILLTNAVGQSWLDYELLSTRCPNLIAVHIAGRNNGKPAVDYTVNCEVGLPFLTGPADFARPVNHVLPAWDLLTGLYAALGVLAAVRSRKQSGKGSYVEISLADVALATMGHLGFIADVVVNANARPRDGNYLYGTFGCDFSTADGHEVMIVALTESHWRNLVELTGIGRAIAALERALGIDLSAEDERYRQREVIVGLMRPWFTSRSFDQVVAALERSRVLWGPYRSVEELVRNPDSLLRESDLMAEVAHPGIGSFPIPRSVLGFESVLHAAPRRAPLLGEHTEEVLSSLLDLDQGDLEHLRAAGLIGATHR